MKKGKQKKGRKGPLSKSEITINPAPDLIINSSLNYENELLMNENEILDNIDNNNNNNNCKLSQINITTFIDKNKSFHSSTPINMNRKK